MFSQSSSIALLRVGFILHRDDATRDEDGGTMRGSEHGGHGAKEQSLPASKNAAMSTRHLNSRTGVGQVDEVQLLDVPDIQPTAGSSINIVQTGCGTDPEAKQNLPVEMQPGIIRGRVKLKNGGQRRGCGILPKALLQ